MTTFYPKKPQSFDELKAHTPKPLVHLKAVPPLVYKTEHGQWRPRSSSSRHT